MKKRILLELIFLILFAGVVSSQTKYPEAILKVPFVATGLSWLQHDTKFLYTEEDKIIVRDVKNYSVLNTLIPSDYVIEQASYFPSSTENDRIIARTSDGNIFTYLYPEEKKIQLPISENYKKQTSHVAFNKTGNNIAFGLEDGSVYLMRTYQVTNSFTEYVFRPKYQSPIYTISFSDNGTYFVSGNESGKASVWNVNSQKLIDEFDFASDVRAPVLFTRDSKKVIYAYDKRNIIVQEFSTNPLLYGDDNTKPPLVVRKIKQKKKKIESNAGKSTAGKAASEKIVEEENVRYEADGALVIHVDDGIQNYKVSTSGRYLVVQTNLNHLRYYNLVSGKQAGYIPNFDLTQIVDYQLNHNDTRILVSHKSGAVFMFDVRPFFFRPNQVPPDLKTFSTTGKGSRFRRGDQIDTRFNYVYHEEPYPIGMELDFGYMAAKMKWEPLYVGAFGEFTFAFPDDNYPYQYYYTSTTKIQNPYLLGAGLIMPVGLHILPFPNPEFYFRTQVEFGVTFLNLWNGAVGDGYIAGDGGFSGSLGTTIGVGWKNYLLNVSFKYDSCLGFVVSTGLGYNRKLFNSNK